MNYSMSYNKSDFNQILGKKISRKLITATAIIVGLSLLEKAI